MPDNVNIEDTTAESTIAKYSPMIKAVAALGFGLASDSPMARGISEGLAKSAISESERRVVQEEYRREQNRLNMEAQQKKLKTELDLIWKVGTAIDDPIARWKYFEQTGYYGKAGIMAPAMPDAPDTGAPMDFSATDKFVKDSDMTDLQKSLYGSYKATALHLQSIGDFDGAAVAQNRALEAIKEPDKVVMWKNDKEYDVFDSKAAAAEAGYPYTSRASAAGVSPADQYIKDAQPLVEANDKLVKDFTTNMLKHGSVDVWGTAPVYDYYENFILGADNAMKVNALAGINESPPLVSYNTPFPNLLLDSYEWQAAGDMLRSMDLGGLDFSDPEALRQVISDPEFIGRVKATAEEMRSEDGGYEIKQTVKKVPAKSTSKANVNLKGDDKDQYDWVQSQMALPESQRHENFNAIMQDLKSRYPSLEI